MHILNRHLLVLPYPPLLVFLSYNKHFVFCAQTMVAVPLAWKAPHMTSDNEAYLEHSSREICRVIPFSSPHSLRVSELVEHKSALGHFCLDIRCDLCLLFQYLDFFSHLKVSPVVFNWRHFFLKGHLALGNQEI